MIVLFEKKMGLQFQSPNHCHIITIYFSSDIYMYECMGILKMCFRSYLIFVHNIMLIRYDVGLATSIVGFILVY